MHIGLLGKNFSEKEDIEATAQAKGVELPIACPDATGKKIYDAGLLPPTPLKTSDTEASARSAFAELSISDSSGLGNYKFNFPSDHPL